MKTIRLLVLPFLVTFCDAKKVKIDNLVLDNGDTQWTSYFKQRPFDVFLGIPYAQPPLGNLRFTLPQEYSVQKETEIYVGDDPERNPYKDSTCTQMNFFEVLEGIEDCLHLNIYVPKIVESPNGKLPVLFWIHGGGFFAGSSAPSFYGPDYLMDYNAVLVTINYRVGPLGFLTLQNDQMPGNLGLHDQILALQWVKKHIDKFNGDPDQITIFGESAGAMAVMYLLVTHQTQGLFSKAIIQSGPIISSYTLWDKQPKLYALRLAEDLGCSGNESEILACLRTKNAMVFAQHTKHFLHYPWVGPNVWKPYFDGENVSQPLFLDWPENLLKSGQYNKVPIVIGYNADEGALHVVGFLRGRADFQDLEDHWETLGSLFLFHRSVDETTENDKAMAKTIKELYFGQDPISADSIFQFIKLSGDHYYYGGTESVVKHLVQTNPNPTYRYLYSHRGTFTSVDLFLLNQYVFGIKLLVNYYTGWKMLDFNFGVCHSDELFVMFKPHALACSTLFNSQDVRANQRLLSYFVNFATSGTPSENWLPTSAPDYEYLEIDGAETEPQMTYNPELKDRSVFWANLFESFNHHLSDTPVKTGLEIATELNLRVKDEL